MVNSLPDVLMQGSCVAARQQCAGVRRAVRDQEAKPGGQVQQVRGSHRRLAAQTILGALLPRRQGGHLLR